MCLCLDEFHKCANDQSAKKRLYSKEDRKEIIEDID